MLPYLTLPSWNRCIRTISKDSSGDYYASIFATALESLPADIFSDLQIVTRLGLTDNRLTRVEANAFEGLIGMTDLSLSSNPRLESILQTAFEGLSAEL